jgi:DNA (cytosine-5)-methyltransferase 1
MSSTDFSPSASGGEKPLKVLDLFSGIGGFSLGLEATGGFKTMAFCEITEYPRKVLKKHWPKIKCYPDIKKLTYEQLKKDGHEQIDVIVGGYPCQGESVAGRQKGLEDSRWLWPEFVRLISECRPTWVIGENVAGHIKQNLDTVLSDLESEGYSARTFSISASSIGANHKRERVWIVAHADENGISSAEESGEAGLRSGSPKKESEQSGESKRPSNGRFGTEDVAYPRRSLRKGTEFGETNENETREEDADLVKRPSETPPSNVAHTESIDSDVGKLREYSKEGNVQREVRREGSDVAYPLCFEQREPTERKRGKGIERGSLDFTRHKEEREEGSYTGWWDIEPDVGRVANGIPNRVDRLKCLGNSLVPQIPYYIGLSILAS